MKIRLSNPLYFYTIKVFSYTIIFGLLFLILIILFNRVGLYESNGYILVYIVFGTLFFDFINIVLYYFIPGKFIIFKKECIIIYENGRIIYQYEYRDIDLEKLIFDFGDPLLGSCGKIAIQIDKNMYSIPIGLIRELILKSIIKKRIKNISE